MRKSKRLITSVLVASMLMQLISMSNLGMSVYAAEVDYEEGTFVEETSEDVMLTEEVSDEALTEESADNEESIEESADNTELTEESDSTEEADVILESTGEGATAGKYVITLQPIQTGLSDFYEMSFEVLKSGERLYYSDNLCIDIGDNEYQWVARRTKVELTEAPTDIVIKMRYKPNAEDASYEDLVYEASFPQSCKNLIASASSIQYPEWDLIDFCKYSIQSTEGNGDLYYIDADGNQQVRHQGEYEVFKGLAYTEPGMDAWYAVTENETVPSLAIVGNVHLVLCDGAKLDVTTDGIYVARDSSLTIYAQDGYSGILNARGNKNSWGVVWFEPLSIDYDSTPAIGGEGDIIINGGHINATGGLYAAAIGSGNNGTIAGNITINGGVDGSRTYVYAQGGVYQGGKALTPERGSGIGTGTRGECGTITINGGTVEAYGGDEAAAIGSGNYGKCKGIYINGGKVYANTGVNTHPQRTMNTAAAIGSGNGVAQDFEIVITGGYVEAISQERGAGIGGSSRYEDGGQAGVITISGENTEIYAASAFGAGIGSGGADVGFNRGDGASSDTMKITIKDGAYVVAISTAGGAGIGGGNKGDGGYIVIDNASVVAHGGASHIRGGSGSINPKITKTDLAGLRILEAYIDEVIADLTMDLFFSEDLSGAGIGGGAGGQTGFVEIRNGARVEAQSGFMSRNAIGVGNDTDSKVKFDREFYEMTKVTYGNYASDNKTIDIKGNNPSATSSESQHLAIDYNYVLIEPADLAVNFDLGKDDEGNDIVIKGGPIEPIAITSGDIIDQPENPVYDGQGKSKEYLFDGWYKDSEYKTPFDFDQPIYYGTTVYGRWIKAYPLTVELNWNDNQARPEKIDISYVNKYKSDASSEALEHTLEGTVTLSESNGWKGTIPVADSTVLTFTENAPGYAAESWIIKHESNKQALTSADTQGEESQQEAVQLNIRTGSEWIKDALHNDNANIKIEITNKRQYTVFKDWGGSDSQKYMAGDVQQTFYWKEAIDHVYAVLQEQQTDGSWITVGEPIKLDNHYMNWHGSFQGMIDESKKYRVRELITDEEIETDGGSGHFVIGDNVSANADGIKEKIMYAPDDVENTEHLIPVIRFEYKPENGNTPIMGAFSVTYEDIDENGNFKILNRRVSAFSAKMQWNPDTEEKPAPKPEKVKAVLQHRENSSTNNWETVETVDLTSENNWEAFFSTTVEDEVDARAYYRIVVKDENDKIVENDGEAVHTVKCAGTADREAVYVVHYDVNYDTGVTTITNKPRAFAYQKIWGDGSETALPYYNTWFVLQYRSSENALWETVDRADCKRGEVNSDSDSYDGVLHGWYDGQYRIREAAYPTANNGEIVGEATIAYDVNDAEYPENGNRLVFRDDPYGSGVELHAYKVTYNQQSDKTIITNTQVSPISVQKVWEDDECLRPEFIFVALLEIDTSDADNSYWSIVETQRLDESNGWSACFNYPVKQPGVLGEHYCVLELKPQGVGIVLDENDARRGEVYYQALVDRDIYYPLDQSQGEDGRKQAVVDKYYSFTYTESGKQPVTYKPSYEIDAQTGLTTITNHPVNEKEEADCSKGHDFSEDGICLICKVVSLELCTDLKLDATDVSYVGDETIQTPEITVSYKDNVLVEGTDYEVEVTGQSKVGNYGAKIVGKNKYTGEVIVEWSIVPIRGLYCSDIPAQVYTGKVIKPEIKVYDDGRLLVLGKDYTVSYGRYNTNVAAKDAMSNGKSVAPSVTITGKGNYSDKQVVTFDIVPYSISSDIKIDDITVAKPAGNRTVKVAPVVKLNGKTLRAGTDYVVSTTEDASDVVNPLSEAKAYDLFVVGINNYSGAVPFKFTITEKTLASRVTIKKITDQKYEGGKEVCPDLEVTYRIGGIVTDVTDNFTVEYKNHTEIGTATAIITAKPESELFAGSKSVTFKITGEQIRNAKLGEDGRGTIPSKIYDGDPYEPVLNLYVGTTPLTDKVDYTVTYTKNVNVGTATAKVTGIGKYTGTKNFTFKITQYKVTDAADDLITIDDGADISVVYEKGGVTPKPVVKMGDVIIQEKKDYTLSYANNKGVAEADAVNPKTGKSIAPKITVTFKGNLSGKKTVNFAITNKDISEREITIAIADKAVSTRANAWKQTAVTIVDTNGKKLVADTDYNKTFKYYSNPECTSEITAETLGANKTVYVKVDGKNNYAGSIVGCYRISEKNISGVSASIEPQTFTGSAICPSGDDIKVWTGLGKNKTELKAGEDYYILPDSYTNNVNKGTATVTIVGKGDYYGTKVVRYTIGVKKFLWWE
ncbi:MAG: hypothetical protein KBS96_00880 [Lachnospiraceae bacterium]|nr:hypothetical protein [Candidatus Colinaster scatohippi]